MNDGQYTIEAFQFNGIPEFIHDIGNTAISI